MLWKGINTTNRRQARKTRKPESSRAREVFARAKVLTTLILGRKRFSQGDFDCSVSRAIYLPGAKGQKTQGEGFQGASSGGV